MYKHYLDITSQRIPTKDSFKLSAKTFIKFRKKIMKYSSDQMPSILKRIEDRLHKIEEILLYRFPNEYPELDFIGAKEASEILKISLPTLYSKVCLREIPFFKKGNRLHFSKKELIQWIKDGKKKSIGEM
ncbi:helix-turn-helix domain-containing protein [Chryseobacterium sp. SL1]|uniref:helix-turn-helix domain-containing protein n=1 Tax=Chryseobacterium sp. SL1 TaxID=2995159 RepID=UPI002274C5BC|nr:helix-turn-helix domain-containing protein [Chryseobacterium sp. SL1]MCY1662645.1 helix-turn-helix domain-containing protein [Chryseobacterium sp. SL1]